MQMQVNRRRILLTTTAQNHTIINSFVVHFQEDRAEIRARAQILITNPDMLHQSLLPVHKQFAPLLANLRYVVVDEGHAYR